MDGPPDPSSFANGPGIAQASAGSAMAGPGLQKDPLTGLFQQDYLMHELDALLRKQQQAPVEATLALLQLENFYEIRRWVCKPEANLLLSDIARLLSQSLPRSVLLCRCAHYEFAALFTAESSLHAQLLLQRVKQAMLSAVSDSIPPQLELRCGVGLVPLGPAIPSAEVMFARARHNLSLALSRQRHSGTLDAGHGAAVAMPLAQLLRVFRDDKLQLSFQALVSLLPDGLRHFEVRCHTPGDELSPAPAALFECANQNALGEHIDRWVLTRCMQELRHPAALDLRLTVTLTLNTLVSTHFFGWLRAQLTQDASLAARLVLQISEPDLLTAQHHMQYFCEQLRELRIKLCICQFGCTPDPFRYLPLLHAQLVKLDVSLLENIGADPVQRDHLAVLTARLHDSGLRVSAGMVEDMSQLPLLWAANIQSVQGFCLHRPGPTLNYAFLRKQTLALS